MEATKNNTVKVIMKIFAKIFIIPNPTERVGGHNGWLDQPVKGGVTYRQRIEGVFGPLDDNDRLVQIWTCDEKSDNWHCHGREDIKEDSGYWPEHFPLSMLKDLHEGESIEVKWEGVTVQCTAAQLEYRYKRFGKFEDCLRSLRG